MARFRDIPPFTRSAGYMVNIGLDYLAQNVLRYVTQYGLDLNPDFQRDYVWKPEQKIRFMEYMLRGGTSGLDIYTNCPTWQHGNLSISDPKSWFVLVDGKQRLDAALGFLSNEFPIFGFYYREFEDRPRITTCNFRWHVNDLATREEVLSWYLDLNSGGTVHSEEELEKVRGLKAAGGAYVRPPADDILKNARLGRSVLQSALEEEERDARERAELAAAEAAAEALRPKKRSRKK